MCNIRTLVKEMHIRGILKRFLFTGLLFAIIGTSNMVLGDPIDEIIDDSFDSIQDMKAPSLISCLRINSTLNFCGEEVPTYYHDIRERLEKEILIALGRRHQVILWLKRGSRYMPYIEEMLRQSDMPDDLKYVAVIESALRPHVGSSKGAVGFWQFIRFTGRKFGLTINSKKDERRNLFHSTGAAIRYLKELHNLFGSWTLSAAAYNMGEEGLQTRILDQKVDDYYKLYLPLETQQYIFKVIAAKMILSNPEKYGFFLTEDDYYSPLEFDCVDVDIVKKTPIHIVAKAANTHFKTIKDLNPELLGNYIRKGSHSILIPRDSAGNFHARYERYLSEWKNRKPEFVYVVKRGDSLFDIANQFNVPLLALCSWNKMHIKGKDIYPGNRIIIYPKDIGFGETFQN